MSLPSITPRPADSSGPTQYSWTRRVGLFLRSPEGHHTILGFVGAALIMFGGFGAGAVPRRDPLLEEAHLSWLRFGHGFWLSSIMV